ncbi:hypothetical protein BC937DRAFT_95233, partial [Endogone sp. FLAS-F59071]
MKRTSRYIHTADQADLIERVEAAEARYSTQISQNPTQLCRRLSSLCSLCAHVICDNIRTIGSPTNTHFFHFSLLPPDILSELAYGLRSKDASDMTIDLVGQQRDACSIYSARAKGQGYANLRHLSLNNQINLSDVAVARIMPHLHHVERLELRGCVKVSDKTMEAVAEHCARTLRYLNVGMTGATLAGLGTEMWIAMLEQAAEQASRASYETGRSSDMAASIGGGSQRRRDELAISTAV